MIKYNSFSVDENLLDYHHGRKDKTAYFSMTPNVVKANEKTRFVVKSLFPQLSLSGTYAVFVSPYSEFDYKPFNLSRDFIFNVDAHEGVLEFEYTFDKEQLYRVIVGEQRGGDVYILTRSDVYALESDLYDLKPLRGDLHCHTVFSDGFETPDMVVKAAKKHGFDFIAVTDHNSYEGSVQAASLNDSDITVIHGEEYSSNFTNMHIISLGAKQPLPEEKYNIIPDGSNPKSSVEYIRGLLADIKENGGLSIMCHPFWKPLSTEKRMDVPLSTVRELLVENEFDAMEIVSGSLDGDLMTTLLQHNMAIEYGATPDKIAYIGITDSHTYSTDPICGKHFTIVFCHSNSEEDILEAIKAKRSVAVQLVDKNNAMCFGQLRYCMYANYLLKYLYKVIE